MHRHDISKFIKFACKELRLKETPMIHLVAHSLDTKKTFGLYKTKSKSITVRTAGRHPVDVMRTIAHELVHLKQSEKGKTSGNQKVEDEASAIAGRIMKKYDIAHGTEIFKQSTFHEDAIPVNSIQTGAGVDGTGAGPRGEPGVYPKKKNTLKLIKSVIKRKMI